MSFRKWFFLLFRFVSSFYYDRNHIYQKSLEFRLFISKQILLYIYLSLNTMQNILYNAIESQYHRKIFCIILFSLNTMQVPGNFQVTKPGFLRQYILYVILYLNNTPCLRYFDIHMKAYRSPKRWKRISEHPSPPPVSWFTSNITRFIRNSM